MTFVSSTMKSQRGKGGGGIGPEETLIAGPLGGGNDGIGRRSEDDPNLVAVGVSENQRGELLETDYAHQLTSGGGKPGQGYPAVREGASVRRLLPVECERLQALPDGHTCSCGGCDEYRTTLQVLWLADRAERETGWSDGVACRDFEEAVLHYVVLHELEAGAARKDRRCWEKARTAGVDATALQSLREYPWPDASSSHRWQPAQRRAHELADALCNLPYARSLGDGFVRRAREAAADLAPRSSDWPDRLGGGVRVLCSCADSKRYAALGDAVTASVSEWIGRRLLA